ncbi:hypothetical protein ACFOY2_24420 [Nonomuraea purpurea]|uniref:Uncharacterized protein n=1 Tax=Nonomuraea purpurea TaxID=1849276 RepID=A0ABV8G9E4_9ACTN
MTRSLLLVSLAAGSFSVPAPSAATEPAIRSITVRPADPVVGARDSVRLVIDVIAKGANGKDGVTVKVEPGAPPGPVLSAKPPALDTPAQPAQPADPAQPDLPPQSDLPAQPDQQSQPDQPEQSDLEDTTPLRPDLGSFQSQPTIMTPPEQSPNTGLGQDATGGASTEAFSPFDWHRVATPPARMRDGWETWRFLPDKRLNRYYPTGVWTITATVRGQNGATVTEYETFQFKRATKLSSVRVEKAGDDVRLRGSLTRIDPRGFTDFGPFAKQPLQILWRAEAAAAWQQVAQTHTDGAGAFVSTVQDRSEGFWRIRYPGTGHYAMYTSRIRQIMQ